MGLIPGMKRNQQNHRLFDEEQLEWILIVRCLRESGLSIADVKEFVTMYQLGNSTLQKRKDLLVAQRQKIEQEISVLKDKEAFLDFKIEHYDRMLAGETDRDYKERFYQFLKNHSK